jgi:hypothetical protein
MNSWRVFLFKTFQPSCFNKYDLFVVVVTGWKVIDQITLTRQPLKTIQFLKKNQQNCKVALPSPWNTTENIAVHVCMFSSIELSRYGRSMKVQHTWDNIFATHKHTHTHTQSNRRQRNKTCEGPKKKQDLYQHHYGFPIYKNKISTRNVTTVQERLVTSDSGYTLTTKRIGVEESGWKDWFTINM